MTFLLTTTTAAFLFCLGIAMVIARKNAILALIGIELMLNASNLNLVAFSNFWPQKENAHVAILFVMAIAAAEVAVGLAIVLKVYRKFRTLELNELDALTEE